MSSFPSQAVAVNAMVEHRGCAAAISSSGLVPFSFSKRVLNEYGVSTSTPESVVRLPLPARPVPRQTAFAFQTPKQMLEEFENRGDIDCTFARLEAEAPAVKQAEAKLEFAKRELTQSELGLRSCDIVAKIDGVVTRRNVKSG